MPALAQLLQVVGTPCSSVPVMHLVWYHVSLLGHNDCRRTNLLASALITSLRSLATSALLVGRGCTVGSGIYTRARSCWRETLSDLWLRRTHTSKAGGAVGVDAHTFAIVGSSSLSCSILQLRSDLLLQRWRITLTSYGEVMVGNGRVVACGIRVRGLRVRVLRGRRGWIRSIGADLTLITLIAVRHGGLNSSALRNNLSPMRIQTMEGVEGGGG